MLGGIGLGVPRLEPCWNAGLASLEEILSRDNEAVGCVKLHSFPFLVHLQHDGLPWSHYEVYGDD